MAMINSSGWRDRWRVCLSRPWFAAAAVTAAYAAFLLLYLMRHDFQAAALIHAGGIWLIQDAVHTPIPVEKNALGYGGQFYHELALDPLTLSPRKYVRLDLPAYRQQRILYPLTAWALSLGGREQLVPAMLAVINLVSLFFLAWLAAVFFQRMHFPLWASLCIPLFPGFVFSLYYDLPEPMAAVLLFSCLLCVRRGRPAWACLALSFGILARDVLIFAALAIAACWLWDNLRTKFSADRACSYPSRGMSGLKWYTGVIPIVVYGIWQGILYMKWGCLPSDEVAHYVFAAPFTGIVDAVRSRMDGAIEWRRELYDAAFIVSMAATILAALPGLMRTGLLSHEKLLMVAHAVLMVFYSAVIYNHRGGIMRAAWECQALACLSIFTWSRPAGITASLGWIVMGLLLTFRQALCMPA